jgi:hypothetical protein
MARSRQKVVKGAKSNRAGVAVKPALAQTIRDMRDLLMDEFGNDFAFVVLGRGETVAASNARDGDVPPEVVPDPPEGRVYTPRELLRLPEGTAIRHPDHGAGELHGSGTYRLVHFQHVSFSVVSDGPPWDKPIIVTVPKLAEAGA